MLVRKQGFEEGPSQTDLLGATSVRLGPPFLRDSPLMAVES